MARKMALDVSQSFIVQAPAGSGKTELLIQRYLALLAKVNKPEMVLAITFTRRAVVEMRHRVLQALQSTDQPKPRSAHAALTWQLASEVKRQANQKQWQLEQQSTRLSIMTIDAFNRMLVRQMPQLSGMGANVAIHANPSLLYEAAAWQTLDPKSLGKLPKTYQTHLTQLLLYLDNRDRRLVEMLSQLLGRRDQWLGHLIALRFVDSQAGRQQLIAMFQAVIASDLQLTVNALDNETGQLLLQIAAVLHPDCHGLSGRPKAAYASLKIFQALADLYLTKTGQWRKHLNKQWRLDPQEQLYQGIYPQLLQQPQLLKALQIIRHLPKTFYDDSQYEILQALIALLPVAVAHLRVIFQQHNAVDYIEYALAAEQALGNDESPSDLALKLDYEIQHVLMDEFQDTSYTQLRLLQKLLGHWQPDEGKSLFLVGDPMQSIYLFREADVGGFLQVREQGLALIKPKSLVLQANFRSTSQLVKEFNKRFPKVLASEDNRVSGAISYTPAVCGNTVSNQDSALHVDCKIERSDEQEASQIVEIIRSHSDGDQRIGVLARSRTHLHQLCQQLQDTDIDFHANEVMPLSEQPAIHDLISLTQTLLYRHNRMAWIAVLRAPWCGLTLKALHTLLHNDPKTDVFNLISCPERQKQLEPGERQRLQALLGIYQNLYNVEHLTIRVRVEWLWRALQAESCYPNSQMDVGVYLDLLSELEGLGRPLNVIDIHNRLAGRYSTALSGRADATVQLMTIHGAKGLEFDTVILPGLHRTMGTDNKPLLAFEVQGENLLLACVPAAKAVDEASGAFDYLDYRQRRREAFETQRLLYVAMTRAKSHLYLLGSYRQGARDALLEPRKGSFLSLLDPVIDRPDQQSTAQEESPIKQQSDHSIRLRRLLPSKARPSTQGNVVNQPMLEPVSAVTQTIEFSWAKRAVRIAGVLVHDYLQMIADDLIVLDKEKTVYDMRLTIRQRLRSMGLDAVCMEQAADIVQQALTNVQRSKRAAWILDKHDQAVNEWAVSGIISGKVVNRIIDRSFVEHGPDGPVRWVIDYKASSHAGGDMAYFLSEQQRRYEGQLHEYASLLKRYREDQPVRCGLYFPVIDAWREWEFVT